MGKLLFGRCYFDFTQGRVSPTQKLKSLMENSSVLGKYRQLYKGKGVKELGV